MGFERDEEFAKEVENYFGEYVSTFRSKSNQVRADLFKEGDGLVAHVSFAQGFTSGSVDDPYLTELKAFADEKGLGSNFRLLMSGS